jgi:hypothetical protein
VGSDRSTLPPRMTLIFRRRRRRGPAGADLAKAIAIDYPLSKVTVRTRVLPQNLAIGLRLVIVGWLLA